MTSVPIDSCRVLAVVTEPAEPLSARLLEGSATGTIEYRVIRSKRRKRTIELSLEVGAVVVRAPQGTSDREIEDLIRQRAAWIARHRPERPPSLLASGTQIPVLGCPLALEVTTGPVRRAQVERDLLGLRVTLPVDLDLPEHEDATREALQAWLRRLAGEVLPGYVERRTADIGRAPSGVLVRNQKRRWGSCAPDGTLRLNWRLVMLDEALIDYVAVHELAHLRQANHSPKFWAVVDGILPDHRVLRRRLREEGRGLPL